MEHSKWVCPFCGGSFWVRTLVTTLTQPFAPHYFCRGQNAVNILMQLAPSPSTQLQPEPRNLHLWVQQFSGQTTVERWDWRWDFQICFLQCLLTSAHPKWILMDPYLQE
jgi:hypothetical protein